MSRVLPLLVILVLGACAEPPAETMDASSPADAATPPPYAGVLTLPVRTQIEWTGPPNEGSIEGAHFVDGRGTLRFEGADVPAIVYEKIPFAEFTLAAIVGMLPDNLLVVYAYCRGTGIDAFYFETLAYTVSMQSPLSSPGSCAFIDEPSTGPVAFTAPSAPLNYAAPEDHADIDGPRLTVHGGTGSLDIAGRRYDLTVFTTVDCDALRCGGLGWYELHVTLRRETELAFAILYMAPERPTLVQLAHGIRLDVPTLWPPDELIPATWTLK